MRREKGFTLVELVVVMGVFMVVLVMTSSLFKTLLGHAGQQMKSAESHIEGIVGLEMLRYDVEYAGYGLPWAYSAPLSFNEVETSLVPGVNSTAFNEAANPPRAVISIPSTATSAMIAGAGNTNPGSDYLVIKSVLTPMGQDARRWTYFNYSTLNNTNKSYLKTSGAANDLRQYDRATAQLNTFSTQGTVTKRLLTSATDFSFIVGSSIAADFMPAESSQTVTVFTINNIANDTTTKLVMPYNRADYYVKVPDDITKRPAMCNPGTGMLYKATVVNRTDRTSSFKEYPLLDCVGDMQVIYYLDMNDDGVAATYAGYNLDSGGNVIPVASSTEGATAADADATLKDPALLRTRLKQVLVYILVHEGAKDRNFSFPVDQYSYAGQQYSVMVGDPTFGDTGHFWTSAEMLSRFGSEWRNYRWKVYTLTVRPKNLTN